ncbi:MAG: hypothetical protein AMXMBFR13_45820 [Phycisphaerae bacterium]
MLADIEVPVILSRWLHLAAVIVAIGGTVFIRFVLHPSSRAALSQDTHAALRQVLIRRWARFVHTCILFIILSGTYNAIVQFPLHKPVEGEPPLYHILFGIKLLLALALFFIAIAVTGRSLAFEGMRRQMPRWLAVNAAIAAVIVLISNVLKNIPPSA